MKKYQQIASIYFVCKNVCKFFPLFYKGLRTILQTFCNFYKQITNIWGFFNLFLVLSNLANPYFMGYLPQHCLYFLPLPQEEQTYKVNHYINPLQKVTFNLNGETKDIGNFNLADIIFEYENKPEGSSEINKNAVLTVENSNVEIVIESAKKFYYDKKYCSVVGNKDFSELLNK